MGESTRIRGVSTNWLSFLWSHLIEVQRARSEGNNDVALGLCTQLIDWLPTDLKEKFRLRANEIQSNMNIISRGDLPSLMQETDLLSKYDLKRKYLRAYSEKSLKGFIDELCRQLDDHGYYTTKQYLIEGQDLTI